MTKKHFEKLAACIKDIEDSYTRDRVCYEVGKVCKACNENFDWDKWEKACDCAEVDE